MDAPLGTLYTVDDRPTLRFERRLAHAPEKVWNAVTDPAEMSHWFPASVEAELRIGAPMRFSFGVAEFDAGGRYADGEILEVDPPKVYAFWWLDDVYRFEVVPDGTGCRLIFTCTLSGKGDESDRPSIARTAPGWDACLGTMVARLGGSAAPVMDDAWLLERAECYIEQFGLAEGQLLGAGDRYVVRFERDLTQPLDRVWATLTGQEEYLAAGASPPVSATHGYVATGAVTEHEPPHVLEYVWHHDDEPAGRVRFELRDQNPLGTRLVLTHSLPAPLGGLVSTVLAAWQTHLELFFAALHGDVRCPWPAERTEQLEKMYATRLSDDSLR